MEDYGKKVVSSFAWQGGAQVLGQAVSWISTLVVIRLLTPEDYGLVAMATLFLGFLFMIADMGFGSAAVQSAELRSRQVRELFGMVLSMNAVSAVLILLLAPAIADFFNEPRLVLIVRVLSVNFILTSLYTVPQALLVRDLEFARKARIDVAATLASAVTAFSLALAGYGVWALVLSMVVLNATKAVLYSVVGPGLVVPSFSIGSIKPFARFGLVVTLDRIVFYFYGQADIAIGGRVLGADVLGLYTVALTIASLPMEKVLPVITQVSFAAFARIQADAARVNRNLLRALRLVAILVFPAFLGLAAVADDLVPVILGDRWLPVVLPFQIICFVLPLKAIAALFPPALFGVGRPGVNLGNMVITAVIMAAAFLVGVRFGAVGLASAWLAAYPVAFVITSARALRTLGLAARDVVGVTIVPAAASLAMLALVEVLEMTLTAVAVPGVVRLFALVAFGAGFYGVVTLLWNRASVDELRLAFKH